jgi:hypothetical protein
MTSDSDDLEQELRQNLKLRRELGGEVTKARDSSAGGAYRLGLGRPEDQPLVFAVLIVLISLTLWFFL